MLHFGRLIICTECSIYYEAGKNSYPVYNDLQKYLLSDLIS